MEIPFAKLHGNGNDFIIIDEFNRIVIPDDMKGQFAVSYCDRRFGIGADGVIFLSKSAKSDIRMRIFQPDASEAEMCGNGIRCLAKFASDAGYVKDSCTVETPAGSLGVTMGYREDEFSATISMTSPLFDRKDIPATGTGDYREHIGSLRRLCGEYGCSPCSCPRQDCRKYRYCGSGPADPQACHVPPGGKRELHGKKRREQYPDPYL